MTRTTLPIAETFYSIQGEGPSAGVPAVFLRTSHCNLRCPGWGPAGAEQGCDTLAVWQQTWRELTPGELLEYWREEGWQARMEQGAHLVLTGGEPLLWQHRFAGLLQEMAPLRPFVEVETNGTLVPDAAFDAWVGRYNCSPKLQSSGNLRSRAYRPAALAAFSANPRAVFKFVVQEPERDLAEIEASYLEPFSIERSRVWLMPEAANRRRLIERSAAVMELARDNGFNFSSRLHLIAWDQATGV